MTRSPSDRSDFAPAASWERLRMRGMLLRKIRDFFEQRAFLEVETPLLSAEACVDRHLDPLSVTLFDDPRLPQSGPTMWLQTSPELAMKRLLAAGGGAIYQVTRAFRGGEYGRLHNPEFTMVEWYRTGDSYQAGMDLLEELVRVVLDKPSVERLSYREAFRRHAKVDPFASDLRPIAGAAAECEGRTVPPALEESRRDEWLESLLAHRVQPKLGHAKPVIIYDFPASQAALACIRQGETPVAERYELFIHGVELANGYHELCDAEQLQTRWGEAARRRAEDGKPPLPRATVAGRDAPRAAALLGRIALGFDRLAMVAAGATSLAEVMTFPVDRA